MTYTYRCNCSNEFEMEKGINEDAEVKCSKCGSKEVKRVYKSITPIWKCVGNYNSTRK